MASTTKDKKSYASRTELYELLLVGTDVTEQDLKKAYRKRSLKLHPDRGGDAEEFKRMKYAYDVLLDPKKRKLYDRYGKAAVEILEGNMSPELAMSVVLNIGAWDRFILIIGLTAITGYLLLFPILLSVRWDKPQSMTFSHVFIPIWMGLAGALCCILCIVRAPESDPEEENEEMKQQVEEKQRQAHLVQINGTLTIVGLFVLLLFLVLRLDGDVNWSYFAVIWPWFVLEIGIAIFKLCTAKTAFTMMHGPIPDDENEWLRMDWNMFVLSLVSPNIFHFIFAGLIASKMDGNPMTWWVVFTPLWVNWLLSMVINCLDCGSIKSVEELESMDAMQQMKEPTSGAIFSKFVLQLFWLAIIVLFCAKLANPTAISAFVVFLPVFIFGGCFCCCLSCVACFMREPEQGFAEAMHTEAGVSEAQAQARYGSV